MNLAQMRKVFPGQLRISSATMDAQQQHAFPQQHDMLPNSWYNWQQNKLHLKGATGSNSLPLLGQLLVMVGIHPNCAVDVALQA